jgi:NAD(P)-dependent dehydrogenase (short-subunit alcohol dehydrogenase family)
MAVALITGTSSGIGRLTAETLAREGHTVYATMRDLNGRNRDSSDALLRLAKEQGLAIRVLDMDVKDEAAIQDAVGEILRETSRIDIVVNDAGLMSIGLAQGFTEAQAAHQMDVNFLGPVRVWFGLGLPGVFDRRLDALPSRRGDPLAIEYRQRHGRVTRGQDLRLDGKLTRIF